MADVTIGDLELGDNPGDGDLFEVEQGGQSKRLTFAQIKAAATGETTLQPSAALYETDRLALSQTGYASGEYWRVLVHTNTAGGSSDRRIHEIQFREQEGVPQSRVDETIQGYNTSNTRPIANAFDGDRTSNTRSGIAGTPFGVGLSRSVPWTVREIAIYYPGYPSPGEIRSPGTFDIQVSSDGENWATVASVEGFVQPTSGWHTFSTASPAVERSASLSQLTDFLAGELPNPEDAAFVIDDLDTAVSLSEFDRLPVAQTVDQTDAQRRITVGQLRDAITSVYPDINVQTGVSYTLSSDDLGRLVVMDSADPNTIVVPPEGEVAFPVGAKIAIGQDGVGQTSVAPGLGVTIRTPETERLRKQWAKARLVYRGADEWDLDGTLEDAP